MTHLSPDDEDMMVEMAMLLSQRMANDIALMKISDDEKGKWWDQTFDVLTRCALRIGYIDAGTPQ